MIIAPGEILTAEHVIRGDLGVNVSVPGVGLVFAEVTGWDRDRDLALLTYNSNGVESVATLATGSVVRNGEQVFPGEIGSPLVALGFVPSISITTPIATFGNVGVRWNIVPGDYSKIQTDAEMTNGMSGGGLWDSYGLLIGIIQTGGNFAGNNRGLAWNEINEVLPDLRAGTKSG